MTRRPPARPLYLDLPSGPVFAVYHAPSADAAPATAVLLCPPWGWNDVTSYRARRAWAEHLADGGHPTLRFDFPGTGDSAGVPADPGRLAAPCSSVWTAFSLAICLAYTTPVHWAQFWLCGPPKGGESAP